jgi:hypothetical protein
MATNPNTLVKLAQAMDKLGIDEARAISILESRVKTLATSKNRRERDKSVREVIANNKEAFERFMAEQQKQIAAKK